MNISTLQRYFNRRILCIFFLGFSSGLPISLVFSTMQAWYTSAGVDIKTIGFLSLIGLPYTYKFLWAPFLDRYIPPFLGRRKGWLLITQLAIVVAILIMACMNPVINPKLLMLAGVLLAFCSASQDIVFDAYKTEVLPQDERGLGAAVGVEGYRVAMLVSGSLALIMADIVGWQKTYIFMSLLMLVGIITTFITEKAPDIATENVNVLKIAKDSIADLFSRDKAAWLILLVILYKLGDAFSSALTTTFLLKGVGFSLSEVGVINKIVGTGATLIGIFFGGILLTRISLFKALLFFGLLQAVTNLLYMWLSIIGYNYLFASTAIFIENLCGGMGTAAFLVFLMSLCNKKYTATQFAVLSSIMVLGRTFCGPISGYLVDSYGWTTFYFYTFLFAIPGIIILLYLKNTISSYARKEDKQNEAVLT